MSLQTPLPVLNWASCCHLTIRNLVTFGKEILMGDQIWIPTLSVLEEIHGTLQWQPDDFEHFNSPWTPLFWEPCSTPHSVSSVSTCKATFRCRFLVSEKNMWGSQEKSSREQHVERSQSTILGTKILLQGNLRFSLFVNRCYISGHEHSNICSSTCPCVQQTALTVTRYSLYLFWCWYWSWMCSSLIVS